MCSGGVKDRFPYRFTTLQVGNGLDNGSVVTCVMVAKLETELRKRHDQISFIYATVYNELISYYLNLLSNVHTKGGISLSVASSSTSVG